jgi:hypothetical protein
MRYACALLMLLSIAPLATPAQKKKSPVKMDTMTGCVDEKEALYVLRSDDMLKELAILEAIGFEKTNFARFVGHKVSITGKLVTTTDPPTMQVSNFDNIKNLSDICTPQ